ncbi:MAG: hypothetical protein KGJ13_02155 [Patescibacteria group bacterium]|nr:hypothetical protein [Patescibacteria group bacterium]
MTQIQTISEAKLQLSQMITTPLLDDQTLRWLVNWGRRDVSYRLLPYKREYFRQVGVSITDGNQIPYNIVGSRLERVLNASLVELRYLKPKEFFDLLGGIGGGATTTNPATTGSPIYTIAADATHARVFKTSPSALVCTMDYYALPTDLATDGTDANTDLGVPAGYDESVVKYVVAQSLLKLNEQDKMTTVYKAYVDSFGGLMGADGLQTLARRVSMQSLPLPAPLPPQQRGEAQ